MWDVSPFRVTPAASLMSRCVSVGVLSQEEIDSASSAQSPALWSHLQEAEQQIRTQRQLDEVQLQLEMLQQEQQSADVAHSFYLIRRFHVVQIFCQHLQEVLRDHKSLRQRLMRPLTRTNLPVPAHLHRSVVDSLNLILDFIQTLEEKISSAHRRTSARDHLTLLDSCVDQLLAQAAEVEALTNKLLQRKSHDL